MTPFPSLCNLLLCFWETVKIWQRSCISLCFCWEITPWAGSLTPVLFLLPSELSLYLQEGPIPDFLENIGHLTNLSPKGGFSNPKKKKISAMTMTRRSPVSLLFPCLHWTRGDLRFTRKNGTLSHLADVFWDIGSIPSTKCRLARSLYQNKSLSSGL